MPRAAWRLAIPVFATLIARSVFTHSNKEAERLAYVFGHPLTGPRIRLDPDARADRFVMGWQAMQRQRAGLEQAGDHEGAEKTRGRMAQAAGGLARDPQLESALRRRAPELEIRIEREQSIGEALARSVGPAIDRDRGLSR